MISFTKSSVAFSAIPDEFIAFELQFNEKFDDDDYLGIAANVLSSWQKVKPKSLLSHTPTRFCC